MVLNLLLDVQAARAFAGGQPADGQSADGQSAAGQPAGGQPADGQSAAGAPSSSLYLLATVNGLSKDDVVAVTDAGNGYAVPAGALVPLGLVRGPEPADAQGNVFFPKTGAFSAQVDMQDQVINFTVPEADVVATLTLVSTPAAMATASSGTGAFLDYNLDLLPVAAGDHGGLQPTLNGNQLGVLFSPYGFLSADTMVTLPAARAQNGAVFTRLSTTYEFDQPAIPRVWRLGDLITTPPGWARAEFIGGFQVETDYGLQPERIIFPTPIIGQSLAQPSNVSLLVNSNAAYQSNLNAGPFSLVGIPVVTGLNEITVQTRSAAGVVTSQTVPFYASTSMLAKGLTAYNISAGYIHHHYGQADSFYHTPAFDGTVDQGITNDLTGTLHAEAAPNLQLLGGGLETSGLFGDISGAAAFSDAQPGFAQKHRTGRLFSAQYSRAASVFGFSAGVTRASSGYNDLGMETGTGFPILSWFTSASLALPDRDSVTAAYTEETSRFPRGNSGFLLASYSRQFFQDWNFDVSGFKGLTRSGGIGTRSLGINIGINLAFGDNNLASASFAAGSDQRPEASQFLERDSPTILGYGGAVENAVGDYSSRSLRLQDVNQTTDIVASVAQYQQNNTAQLQVSGSVIALDGLYFSRPANDSFAVVDLGYPHIQTYLANQPVGKTNRSGKILIPNLLPYYQNDVSIDANALPLNASVEKSDISVAAPRFGGVIVRFPAQKLNAALLTIKLPHGGVPAAGSLLVIAGNPTPIVIGYDGAVYIENPPLHLHAVVYMAAGKCRLDVRLPAAIRSDLRETTVRCKN